MPTYYESNLARQVQVRVTAGCTTRADELRVLWIGDHLALVKWPGGRDRGVWIGSIVALVDIAYGGRIEYSGGKRVCHETVHRSEAGRLTPKRVEQLIARARLRDQDWPKETELHDALHAAEQNLSAVQNSNDRARAGAEAALIQAAFDETRDGDLPYLAMELRRIEARCDEQHAKASAAAQDAQVALENFRRGRGA